jgi:predicted dehydrogenase
VTKNELRIGMVGYRFMGKAHSLAYRNLPFYFKTKAKPVLQAIAGRNELELRNACEQMGWNSYETDWKRLIERDDIDVIDIVTPNNSHAEIAIAAAEAGKHILCEKPIALTVEEAEKMLAAVKKTGIIHMVCHNYRFAPAVQYAKRLIDTGKLGRVRHFRAQYLQDWLIDPKIPFAWRMNKETTGSGALGDIASHSIDLSRFLVGEIDEVIGMMETFIKERPAGGSREGMVEVNVDDATAFLAKFKNGAMGVFEASRFAAGHRNGNQFEINGEKASIRWNMEKMNELEVYFTDDEDGCQGFRTINCTEVHHPFAGAYWPSGHIIGYEHTFINLVHEFINGIAEGVNPTPSFEDGLKNQKVLAAIERSVESKTWVKL